jgi:hypothetical protein
MQPVSFVSDVLNYQNELQLLGFNNRNRPNHGKAISLELRVLIIDKFKSLYPQSETRITYSAADNIIIGLMREYPDNVHVQQLYRDKILCFLRNARTNGVPNSVCKPYYYYK